VGPFGMPLGLALLSNLFHIVVCDSTN
jgi:hypothetical protein